jgi:maltose alpha-D-glucosyltransferase/alpha-amylase
MQWSVDRNAGFSRANPQQLYLPLVVDHEYHHETIHVEAQEHNPSSLLNWMKRLIQLRARHRAFGRGDLTFLQPDNRKILAFIRSFEGEQILVVANMSRYLQHVQLDLGAFCGRTPIELFGRTPFPTIGELPYLLTLAPHAFYWFSLEQQPATNGRAADDVPAIEATGEWRAFASGDGWAAVDTALPHYLRRSPWFNGKSRTILSTAIQERIAVPTDDGVAYLAIVRVRHTEGEPEAYAIAMAYAEGTRADEVRRAAPEAAIADVRGARESTGLLYDALWSKAFARSLIQVISRRLRLKGEFGAVVTRPASAFQLARRFAKQPAKQTSTIQAGHNNTSIAYAGQLILKLFRYVDEGINPEIEIGDFLTAKGFANTPPMVASLEYRGDRGEIVGLATVQGFVPNQGEAWEYTLAELQGYFERAKQAGKALAELDLSAAGLLDLAAQKPPAQARELIGPYIESARRLGQRSAELHVALASSTSNPDFAPQPFTPLYQRSLYQSMRSLAGHVAFLLRRDMQRLPDWAREDARALLGAEKRLLQRFRAVADQKIDALRMRVHGDFHLAQALYTGDDFIIFDFEGEPDRPVMERRLKASPLRDVAAMLRSLRYATYAARLTSTDDLGRAWQAADALGPWARFWYGWSAAAFLGGYLEAAEPAAFLPAEREQLGVLLDVFLLERAIYALRDEPHDRPEQVRIARREVEQLLSDERRATSDKR